MFAPQSLERLVAVQLIVALLFVANTINIGADLSAMADAATILVGGFPLLYVIAFATFCLITVVFMNYSRYVTVLKWLTLSLFAYVAAAFVSHVSWRSAFAGALLPHVSWSSAYFTTLVAILGTTISPYLFFWASLSGSG